MSHRMMMLVIWIDCHIKNRHSWRGAGFEIKCKFCNKILGWEGLGDGMDVVENNTREVEGHWEKRVWVKCSDNDENSGENCADVGNTKFHRFIGDSNE